MRIWTLTLFLIFTVTAAMAGVRVETLISGGGETHAQETLIDDGKVRFEMPDEDEGDQIIIFRKDLDLIWIISPARGSYMEFTREDMQRMKSFIDEARKQMEATLERMPPEQRESMRRMMAENMPGAGPEPSFERVGTKVAVGDHQTEHYVQRMNGEKISEMWTVDPKRLGLAEEMADALGGMADFFADLQQGAGDGIKLMGTATEAEIAAGTGFRGIPVKSVLYDEDGVTTIEMGKIEKTGLDAALFEVPEGLSKSDPMDGAGF